MAFKVHEYKSFILLITARLQLLSEGSEEALLDMRRELCGCVKRGRTREGWIYSIYFGVILPV